MTMAFNPFDPELFAVSSACRPCCPVPFECVCALEIPPTSSPYSSITDAQDAITNWTSNCVAYLEPLDAYTSNPQFVLWSCITLPASTLTIAWSFHVMASDGGSVGWFLYSCGGVLVDSGSTSIGPPYDEETFTGSFSVTVPADGIYLLKCVASNAING